MNITIPIYVHEHTAKGAPAPTFVVRPLFADAPQRKHNQLSRALAKLAQDVRGLLDDIGRTPLQQGLARWAFNPALAEHRVEVDLELKKQTAHCRLLVLVFEAMDRRIAMAPAVPDLWFDVPRGQGVRERTAEALLNYVRRKRQEDEEYVLPPALTGGDREYVTSMELDAATQPEFGKPQTLEMLLLGDDGPLDGRRELEKVGQCLDWLYPDELDRVMSREVEAEELSRLLSQADRRPVLLLGRPKSGKTALIHECVWRRVAARKKPYVAKGNVWQLSPPRLISGMSRVGQWENRLLAIVENAIKQDHVLYFDDVLGLYHAGQSRDSDLNVAMVLRPYIERRDFRLLAEMTPEAFRVLREQDRFLADLFHVMPMREPGEAEARRVLVSVCRQLEFQHPCRFALDALPLAIDLQQRYVRDQALPGKVAGFLRPIAAKSAGGGPINRVKIFREFHAKSGLSINFLDDERKLHRQDVIDALKQQVIGQDAAVGAMADIVCVAKARLNDVGRPLASLLFLGPTGVGKTQCAKALATYLFGDAERFVRFDMNEYLEPGSATRLVGTFRAPEGLLTSAVRRQPFSVILLDEIEKADPSVFDLLLQVLGEGRLTDSLGRTADFGNAIIIMTSNLGARESMTRFGLKPAARSAHDTFLSVARSFFRPEFFNRIDRVVPFESLGREQIAGIAKSLIDGVFSRDGLVHRRVVLEVDPAAMEKIIHAGYHPQLGARALKRAIEKQLAQPVAVQLAGMTPGTPTLINLYPRQDGIAVHVQELANVPCDARQLPPLDDAGFILDRVDDLVQRVEADLADLEPTGHLTQGQVSRNQFRYLAAREQLQRVVRTVEFLDRKTAAPPVPRTRAAQTRNRRSLRRLGHPGPEAIIWKDITAAEDLHAQLSDLAASIPTGEPDSQDHLRDLLGEAALLHRMALPPADETDRCLLLIRSARDRAIAEQEFLAGVYLGVLKPQHGCSASSVKAPESLRKQCELVVVEMPAASAVMAGEHGTHLFLSDSGHFAPVQVQVIPLQPDDDAAAVALSRWKQRAAWREKLAAGQAAPEQDPFRLGMVLRIYDELRATVDLPTGMVATRLPTSDEIRRFILAHLALPGEIAEQAV